MIKADNLKACAGIRHGFFTRENGHSSGIYASRNTGLGSGDDRETVGQFDDDWLCNAPTPSGCDPRETRNVVLVDNILSDFPASFSDQVLDAANGNRVGIDPLFFDDTNPDVMMRDYHLRQGPDQSPWIDKNAVWDITVDGAMRQKVRLENTLAIPLS